jgi:hypothetical protein
MPPPILIIDGVTGAGKTSVLTELRSRMASTVEFIPEEDTLGDLMNQIRDPLWCAQPTFAALDSVLQRLEDGITNASNKHFVVERFHLTAFALFPRWECYQHMTSGSESSEPRLSYLRFRQNSPRHDPSIAGTDRIGPKGWTIGMAPVRKPLMPSDSLNNGAGTAC